MQNGSNHRQPICVNVASGSTGPCEADERIPGGHASMASPEIGLVQAQRDSNEASRSNAGSRRNGRDRSFGEENIQPFHARDGHELKLRTFRAAREHAPGPLIVLWHGGGWILGSPTMVADLARDLVKSFPGAVVVAPNYRLAPEHPWPSSINDGWDAFNHIRSDQNLQSVADTSKGFVIGGISAGASMALAFAHLARDEGLTPKITGVYSACGSVRPLNSDLLEEKYRERYLSRTQEECINNPVLSKDLVNLMFNCAKPDVTSKLYAPLLWPDGDGHKGLPRIYQQLCGRDASRDEGLVFDDILKRESGESKVDLYAGLPHCFWLALGHLPESDQWQKDTLEGFRWLLRR